MVSKVEIRVGYSICSCIDSWQGVQLNASDQTTLIDYLAKTYGQ
jgi:hypothetical protein